MSKQCPHCKELNPDNFEKCQWCGKRFDEPVREQKIAPQLQNTVKTEIFKNSTDLKTFKKILFLTSTILSFYSLSGGNFQLPEELLPMLLFFSWSILPYIVYLAISSKIKNQTANIIVGLLILGFQFSIIVSVSHSTYPTPGYSTAGIALVIWPLWAILFMPVVYLFIWVFEKTSKIFLD